MRMDTLIQHPEEVNIQFIRLIECHLKFRNDFHVESSCAQVIVCGHNGEMPEQLHPRTTDGIGGVTLMQAHA